MKVLIPLVYGFCLTSHPALAREVKLEFNQTLAAEGVEFPYRLSMTLTDVAPTRIGVEAILDLREVQEALSERLNDTELANLCNAQVTLETLSTVAQGNEIAVQGRFAMEAFKCDRKAGQPPQRIESIAANSLTFTAAASVQVQDQCVYFELGGMDLTLAKPIPDTETQAQFLSEAQAIFQKASNAVLQRNPVCPTLPPELSSIDPRFASGGTVEISNGGIGVTLKGSFDVSPGTILDVLKVLQQRGVLPAAR